MDSLEMLAAANGIDLDNVDWNSGGKVHNWKNYATQYVIDNWDNLDRAAKLAIWDVCESMANREEWD